MDLQWQRQTELWLRLLEARDVAAQERLTLRHEADCIHLERLNNRALLSLSRPLAEPRRQATLHKLLALLQPEACNGVPLRTWLAQGRVWLAATAPPDSGAEQWASISRQQRRLMDRVMEDSHEKDQ
ncbi:type III secretion protein [Chromobacterium piscinae]|nr:type III secretion protein [Chromobacterium piscinae]